MKQHKQKIKHLQSRVKPRNDNQFVVLWENEPGYIERLEAARTRGQTIIKVVEDR